MRKHKKKMRKRDELTGLVSDEHVAQDKEKHAKQPICSMHQWQAAAAAAAARDALAVSSIKQSHSSLSRVKLQRHAITSQATRRHDRHIQARRDRPAKQHPLNDIQRPNEIWNSRHRQFSVHPLTQIPFYYLSSTDLSLHTNLRPVEWPRVTQVRWPLDSMAESVMTKPEAVTEVSNLCRLHVHINEQSHV